MLLGILRGSTVPYEVLGKHKKEPHRVLKEIQGLFQTLSEISQSTRKS